MTKTYEFFLENISYGTSTSPFGGPFKELREIAKSEGLMLTRTKSWYSNGVEHFTEEIWSNGLMLRRDLWEQNHRRGV